MGRIVSEVEVWVALGEGGELSEWERAVCDMAIRRAEGSVIRYLGYDPVWGEEVEFLPRVDGGGWRGFLTLSKLPVREWDGMAVWVDEGREFGVGTEEAGWLVDWSGLDGEGRRWSRSGFLRRVAGSWPRVAGAVKVCYLGGFRASEFRGGGLNGWSGVPIWQAAVNESVRLAKRMFAMAKRQGGVSLAGLPVSERLGDYGYSLGGSSEGWLLGRGDLSEESLALLDDYVNYPLLLGG